jgi:peptide/nickel transport system ATP-binding protein
MDGQVPVAAESKGALIDVVDLTVSFGPVRAVEGISLSICGGEIYAVVGESGCGKSTLAMSLLALVPPPGQVTGGEVRFRGSSLQAMRPSALRHLRGREIAIVFQAAMRSFNPVITIGRQVDHVLEAHPDVFTNLSEGRRYFAELLRLVRLDPGEVWGTYESRLSGGMKQRVAIAIALLLRPAVVVLDEPTTALDVLNQRLVIDIVRDVHEKLGTTLVFVTHDLGLVAELAERIAVMYAGRLVEVGTAEEVFFAGRRHPYVKALINAVPSITADRALIRPLPGQVPNLDALPMGCRFAPRCTVAEATCQSVEPVLVADRLGHAVACHVANHEVPGTEGRHEPVVC